MVRMTLPHRFSTKSLHLSSGNGSSQNLHAAGGHALESALAQGGSASRSNSPGPKMSPGLVSSHPGLMLKVYVIKYLVLHLGEARDSTICIPKSLDPEWDETIELPVVGLPSLLLEAVCWDKDRFGKDYMGEFSVALEDAFGTGNISTEPTWYKLQSRKTGRKKSVVTGEVLLSMSLYDPLHSSATPQQIQQRLLAMAATLDVDDDDDTEADKLDSDASSLDDTETEGEMSSGVDKTESHEKRKRRLKLRRLKRRAKQHAYEFSGLSGMAGVVFLEIQKITDLPPEKNGTSSFDSTNAVTRTSFDVDAFVVTSLGKKTYKTKVVRHNLNPVFDEKLVFQVLRHEQKYSLHFAVLDHDKLSNHDSIGTAMLPLESISSLAPKADPETGLYQLKDPEAYEPSKKSRFRVPLSRSTSSNNVNANKAKPPGTSLPHSLDASQLTEDLQTLEQDPDLKSFLVPLLLRRQDRWEDKHRPVLSIRAKYLPYRALRQQFWRSMLKQYDADENGYLSKVELTTMLDTLGSTLHDSTIDRIFDRHATTDSTGEPSLSSDSVVRVLEELLDHVESQYRGTPSGPSTPGLTISRELGMSEADDDATDLADDRGEEHVVEIRECPICHQPRLTKKSDADIVTHIATCASQDWRQVNNIVMAGFVTSSQAQRKWYSKVVTKIGYGGYKLGANSANILVQDRITGQINEERMSVYVRLGIRLLYKGLKSREMEKKRIRKMLRSMSFKQGRKYDDPASAAEIQGFINFHKLDMSEVLQPTSEFKNFNDFFYRKLKPDARPCSAPDRPEIVTSPADCRSVVFNTLTDAQTIWVKGREFTVERLLGAAYPQDVKRYTNGALGIFRLAPQDYHRFHIPVDGVLDEPKLIDGEYYTVNPMAIRSTLDVYGENVRVIVPIDSTTHGRVTVVCVGAMMVGSTVITRKAGERVARAEELGYFKFGGSTLLLLFEPGRMVFDEDLVGNSMGALETLLRVGMSVGHSQDRAPHAQDMRKDPGDVTQAELDEAQRRIAGSVEPHAVAPGPLAGIKRVVK